VEYKVYLIKKGPYKGRYKYKFRKKWYNLWRWARDPFGEVRTSLDLDDLNESILSDERLSGVKWEQSKF